ncbi:hypothetical protein GN316_08325 [Xylophilus sp. Kf1]|nr:hypothetical protein [Xylophilus sp. Kf1]
MKYVPTRRSNVFFKAASLLHALVLGCSLAATSPSFSAVTESAGQPPFPVSAELRQEIEAYRLCARLNLPSDFNRVKDAASAATVALDRCRRHRFAVAGQFALDYPGTVRTKAFIDGLTLDLVNELAAWVDDVNARRVSPEIPRPERHTR